MGDMKYLLSFLLLITFLLSTGCVSENYRPDAITTTQITPPPTTTPKYIADATPYITNDPYATPAVRSSVYLLPVTGLIIKGSELSGGFGKLTIDNMNGGSDAIAVITNDGLKDPLIGVYIQKKTVYTLRDIKDGNYNLYIYHGENWNRSTKKFESNSYYSKFEDIFPYQTTEMGYTTWTVTLYQVVDGNAKEETLSEESFPEI